MTNTIQIINNLIDNVMPMDCLYAILSDNHEVQYVRTTGPNTQKIEKLILNTSMLQWQQMGIVTDELFNSKIGHFHHQGFDWQVHIESISHLHDGHYWLLLFAPASYPVPLCASFLKITSKLLTEKVTSKDIKEQVDSAQLFTFAIMNSLKFGVIAVDNNGCILYANDHACISVNTRRRELLKIPVHKLIENWESINELVLNGGKFQNEEVMVLTSKGKVKYNVGVSPIQDLSMHYLGMVISLRELGNVYQIVNKYTGMQARFSFDDIVGKSQEMRKLIDYAKTVSNSPSTILIEGESGTGKEVFAQSIHNASSRRDADFVAINCAAIPESLIESELFGYEDGAFTGAIKGGKPGKFELANGGTLFLDEIGDMKLDTQVKLLRAIQESAITRVGSNKVVPIDVRIIAATNKNLKQEVENGKFRLDLYYRLSVIPLKLPPLRERKSDLPTLIRLFLNKKSIRLGKKVPTIHFNEFQKLLDYNWPGNIRELENFVEQLVNLDGNFSLGYFQEQFAKNSSSTSPLPKETSNEQQSFHPQSINDMEKRLIEQTIAFYQGNISKVAKSLHISRNTLYLKMKRYNLHH